MTIALQSEAPPLTFDQDGNLRGGGTRVTLDSVLAVYFQGATADAIVEDFPALTLADVRAVLAFYHRHRPDVEAYLVDRKAVAARVRAEIDLRNVGDDFPDRVRQHRQARSRP